MSNIQSMPDLERMEELHAVTAKLESLKGLKTSADRQVRKNLLCELMSQRVRAADARDWCLVVDIHNAIGRYLS